MLKIIALITMLIDHVGYVFFPYDLWLRMIGRLAMPLFAYGIAQGYKNTHDLRKYEWRLLIIAIVSQVPYYLLFEATYPNIVFNLLLGLLALEAMNRFNPFVGALVVAGLCFISQFFYFEYGMYVIISILLFYYVENAFLLIAGFTAITAFFTYYEPFWIYQNLASLSSVIIVLFRNNNIRVNKWISYTFYPAHLMILYLITLVVY